MSHAHADNEICKRYAEAITARGYDVWLDLKDMQAGNQLNEEIQAQLQQRTAFLLMLSETSVKSFWVKMETGAFWSLMAEDPDRVLIPVRILPSEVPVLLRGRLYIDALELPFEKSIDEIVAALDAPRRDIFPPPIPKGHIPRRVFLAGIALSAGLGALATAAIALVSGPAGLGAWGVSPTPAPLKLPTPTPTPTPSPTPTPKPGDALLIYRGHAGKVKSVAWSPDGSMIASASTDRTVHLWDATTGAMIRAYTGHSGPVNSVAWSPDGKRIASASDDHTVQIWSASTGKTLLTYKGHSARVSGVAWSHDGSKIASSSHNESVQVWDAGSGHLLLNYHPYRGINYQGDYNAAAWSPDGRYIASASSVAFWAEAWDCSTGGLMRMHRHDGTGGALAVDWSPSGKYIVSGGADQMAVVWNPRTGTKIEGQNWDCSAQGRQERATGKSGLEGIQEGLSALAQCR